jgi:hypothetical protein
MLDSHELITLAITAVAAGLICLRRRQLADALNEAFNNFRGGPRPPSHPLPGDDAFIVRRKRRPVTR